jgi:NAD+ diphosphatase
MTRYADRPYKKLSLVAGFMEIGETLENTIKREVMEEVGLRVKNIRYFKSQPWAFSQSLLVGFFADLDGNSNVNLDFQELSEAMWLSRDEIPLNDSTISLTAGMVEAFRNDKVSLIH